jgi:hypothetical protein
MSLRLRVGNSGSAAVIDVRYPAADARGAFCRTTVIRYAIDSTRLEFASDGWINEAGLSRSSRQSFRDIARSGQPVECTERCIKHENRPTNDAAHATGVGRGKLSASNNNQP